MATEPSWQEINSVFEAALDLTVDERRRFVATACGDDKALRDEVEGLLAAAGEAENFLELPAFSEAWESGLPPRIGPYRVLREIGHGGMGTVYLAIRDDGTYRQQVAIKVLRGDAKSDDLLRRFHSERQILAQLDHPYIARLMDGGSTTTNRPYFVMEYIEGEPIDAYCKARDLDLPQRIELFRQICSAVQYAHQNLIVHRDLKPSNILVTADGTPKLLDFGIAKLLSPSWAGERTELTEDWQRALTPQYASPEQVRGELITTASDIYSLGVLLYKLLSGHLPYHLERHTPVEVERLICQQEPPWPSTAVVRHANEVTPVDKTQRVVDRTHQTELRQLHRRLAGDLDHIVMKALRKEPHQRYLSAEQLAEDLRRYLVALPVIARQGTLLYRAGRFLRRYRIAVGVAAAFLILVFGFATTTAVQSRRIAHQRDQAQQERAAAQLERQRAERISSFLVNLFELSDPEKASGRTISARELLDQGAARIDRELSGQPRLQAELMATMGKVYWGLGLYRESELLFRDVLRIHQTILDSEPLEIAQTLFDLARALAQQGEHAEAEKICSEALNLRRLHLIGDHPELAQSLNQLGEIKMVTGDYPAADRLLREALTMRQRLFGAQHEELVSSLHPLASNLLLSGDLEEAEATYRQALGLAREFYGDRAHSVATISGDLAMALGRKQRFDEAAELLRTGLEIYSETLPSGHPAIAASQGNLAGMLVELGQFEEAESLALSSLELDRGLLGEDYYGTASSLLLLGRIRFFTGQLDKAEKYCRESLEVMRVQLGEGHPHSGHPLIWLGRIELARGRPGNAEPPLRQALTIWKNMFPEGHSFIAKAEGALGVSLAAQGHVDEGRMLLEESYRILQAREGEEAEFTRWVSGHRDDLQ